jgi:hypothetical protein
LRQLPPRREFANQIAKQPRDTGRFWTSQCYRAEAALVRETCFADRNDLREAWIVNRPTRRSRTNSQSLQSKTTLLIPSYPHNPYLNCAPARITGDGVVSIGGADFDKTMTNQLGDLAVSVQRRLVGRPGATAWPFLQTELQTNHTARIRHCAL